MAEVYNLEEYRKKIQAEKQQEEAPPEKLAGLEEIATVMMMSSDELFVELLARVEYGESLRDNLLSTSTSVNIHNKFLNPCKSHLNSRPLLISATFFSCVCVSCVFCELVCGSGRYSG